MIDAGKDTAVVPKDVTEHSSLVTAAEAEKYGAAIVVQYWRPPCESLHHMYDDSFLVFLAQSSHVIWAPYVLTQYLDEDVSYCLSRAKMLLMAVRWHSTQ